MADGKVIWFNDSKGFGFLTKEAGGDLIVEFGSVKVAAATPNKSNVRRNVKEGQIAMARAMRKIVKPGVKINVTKGVPLFYAESEHPGKIVRELDGKRAIGMLVNGKFRISR